MPIPSDSRGSPHFHPPPWTNTIAGCGPLDDGMYRLRMYPSEYGTSRTMVAPAPGTGASANAMRGSGSLVPTGACTFTGAHATAGMRTGGGVGVGELFATGPATITSRRTTALTGRSAPAKTAPP